LRPSMRALQGERGCRVTSVGGASDQLDLVSPEPVLAAFQLVGWEESARIFRVQGEWTVGGCSARGVTRPAAR
jgi:hypothetical protein